MWGVSINFNLDGSCGLTCARNILQEKSNFRKDVNHSLLNVKLSDIEGSKQPSHRAQLCPHEFTLAPNALLRSRLKRNTGVFEMNHKYQIEEKFILFYKNIWEAK